MSTTNEPRALTAALSSPAFVTRGGGMAMHAANRHVSRWAPEVGEPGANRIRPLRNLGFVDRLVSPWIESAQRSASLRMFSQAMTSPVAERPASNVSWVFPRPWYQDELDWMAAARVVGTQTAIEQSAAPQMFTTRGTYVAPQQVQSQRFHSALPPLPSALYEYVAPSLSIARPQAPTVSDAYSPLVPLAATGSAQVIARAMAPLLTQSAQPSATPAAAAARMSPGLRAVLSTMLERSSQVAMEPSRISAYAPELVTPPAPRADAPAVGPTTVASSYEQATQIADQYAEQRVHIAELQRVARAAAEREYVAREAARIERAPQQQQPADPGRLADVRAAEARAIEQRQAELQQRATDVAAQRSAERAGADTARRDADRAAADAERARIEERIAQRIAERQEAQRLHAASRDAAARDARIAPMPESTVVREAPRVPETARVANEIAAAVAALPPELATMVAGSIGNRPERAAQAIAELSEALRTVELIARNTAAGGMIEPTRGPRLVMPAGLGGLVSTVERTAPATAARIPTFAMQPVAAPRPAPQMRMPAMQFLAPQAAAGAPAPTSALGAATTMAPAALSHVAWSDRWLARFAGAKTSSLDVLSATSGRPEMALAAAAPDTVFVAPFFDDASRQPTPVAYADGTPVAPHSIDALPTLRNAAPAQAAMRFDDNAETPDDVFAAISRARTVGATPVRSAAPTPTPAPTFERETLVDLIAHAPPAAPSAGLSAGLASSPFAPALRHLMPLGAAPTFDVRSLFGGGLGATYLAGLLAASTDEITTAAALPTWASWAQTAGAMTSLPALGDEQPVREIMGFEPTYVAPELPRAAADVEGATAQVEAAQAQAEHMTTLRSALLSFDVETIAAQGAPVETRSITSWAAPTVAMGPTLARSMVEMMSLPMLGETAALGELGALDLAGWSGHASSYAAPGMIADRAMGWSVAQERSTSDLAFDFVSPELVLAARVYGLGPAEAAQAARLAIAGPGQLTAMAGAVDRTFVQALAIESEKRGERRQLATAYPTASGETAAIARPVEEPVSTAHAPMSTSAFGVERRTPRGAFLWPAATTAALGLHAAAPDGELSMSVAALELLAAQAVAEIGTYAALSGGFSIGSDGKVSLAAPAAEVSAASEGTESDVLASAVAMIPEARREKFQALYVALGQSSSGKSASPAARAARALALAGRGDESISPRERANIAWDVLPVVHGAGGDSEREALSTGDSAVRTQKRRDELLNLGFVVDARPGLGALSARAGEALGSYVGPASGAREQAASSSTSSSRGEMGAVLRAPTAAQELVQTGRPSGRHGGGEVEIPPWFEAAARKMLEDRSQVSEGISLAELTLVQTAAPTQIAASSRGSGGHSQPSAPAPAGGAGAEKEKIDIEKLANEVYREILILMDIARARNGEPYL